MKRHSKICNSCGQLETKTNQVRPKRWGKEWQDICDECTDYRDTYEIDILQEMGYVLETTSQKAIDHYYRIKYGKLRYS